MSHSAPIRRGLIAALIAVPLVAFVGGGLSGPAAGESSQTGRYWIVLGSNRDGGKTDCGCPELRPYSVRSDGARLTPLLTRGRGIEAGAISRDGSTIAYRVTGKDGATTISVSRADGTDFHQVMQAGEPVYSIRPALSRDGRLLAFEDRGHKISIVDTNGQGSRQLTSGSNPDWAPDGSALVFADGRAIVVQPLSGSRREVVHRTSIDARPAWSLTAAGSRM